MLSLTSVQYVEVCGVVRQTRNVCTQQSDMFDALYVTGTQLQGQSLLANLRATNNESLEFVGLCSLNRCSHSVYFLVQLLERACREFYATRLTPVLQFSHNSVVLVSRVLSTVNCGWYCTLRPR